MAIKFDRHRANMKQLIINRKKRFIYVRLLRWGVFINKVDPCLPFHHKWKYGRYLLLDSGKYIAECLECHKTKLVRQKKVLRAVNKYGNDILIKED